MQTDFFTALQQHALTSPDKPAIISGNTIYSYAKLYDLVQTTAATYRKTYSGQLVGVMYKNSITQMVSYLALCLAEIPFIILDSHTPKEKIVWNCLNAGIENLLSDTDIAPKIYLSKFKNSNPDTHSHEHNEIKQAIFSHNLAYGIYTSGSTSLPKCVLHPFQNVEETVLAYSNDINLNHNDTVAMFASPSHDAALVDLFSTLYAGATLFTIAANNPIALKNIYRETRRKHITIWHCVPTILNHIAKTDALTDLPLRLVVSGGEPLPASVAHIFTQPELKIQLFNLYGQSECSYICGQFITSDSNPNVFNTSTSSVELLCTQGDQLGDLLVKTSRYSKLAIIDGIVTKRIFTDGYTETGDLAYLRDDTICLAGRADHVINVNGERISLDEVEHQLKKMPGVTDAIAFGVTENDATKLHAIFEAPVALDLNLNAVNAFLHNWFPKHISLHGFTFTDTPFPRLASHKVDRKAVTQSFLLNHV